MNDYGRSAYVAGRFGDWRHVRNAQEALRRVGYGIAYDWTVHAEAGENERDGSLWSATMRRAAEADMAAASTCARFVLVCRGDMADALGCYVELGAALVGGASVDVIAPPRPSIFWHLNGVRIFADAGEWAEQFEAAA